MGAGRRFEFQIGADAGTGRVAVRLESHESRWVAVAEGNAASTIAVGRSARIALTSALTALAPRAAAALLADPELFAVSWRIRQAS